MQSVEDSVNNLSANMFEFTQKTRRQRINQRNRVERLSPLLDWKNLGIEYSKARQLALRRAYPDAFYGEEDHDGFADDYFGGGVERMKSTNSMPASPRLKGYATPGDIGTLTEDVSFPGQVKPPTVQLTALIDAGPGHRRLPRRQLEGPCRRGRHIPIPPRDEGAIALGFGD